jgi:beta-galactosidase
MNHTAQNNQRIRINDGWMFAMESPQDFVPVEIPHDWLIADTQNLYQSGVGFYRRALDASFLQKGQRLYLRFDGVYMDSTVWIDGRQAFEWKNGCTAFSFDITDFITPDAANEILVRVNYQAPNARWYTGAGIYRDVFLLVKNTCHIVPDGVYISTVFQDGAWRYRAQAEAITHGEAYTVRHALVETGEPVRPWCPEDPQLYTLRSELTVNGEITDTVFTRFGFRSLRFSPDEGFFLNGNHVKLHGVCLHGDLGGLGGAVYRDALRRQLTLMMRMGANAVRTAHNPPAEALMELADELGLLVISEISDVWHEPKTPYDYTRFFDEWIERDVAAWIRRDRNHPSVILWSVGNEIHDTHLDAEESEATLRRLTALVRRHDPDGNAPCTLGSNYMWWENAHRCADIVKIIGYNYSEALYPAHHAAHPDWVLYGSESLATVQSRGVYHFPLEQSLLSNDDLQCSALGNSVTSWGTKNMEACMFDDLQTPYTLGHFLWAGQDYLGEPTPYQTKNSYFGHMDTAGFAKDSYYVIQAVWNSFAQKPVLHLFPYWDFSPGESIDVRVCTNAPAVELFLNGENLGKRELNGRVLADWKVPYRPGVLLAVAYDAQGRPALHAERRSFGDAASLTLWEEVFGELHFVTVAALDGDGNPVENANRRVRVQVKNGKLLALDNGDSTDYDPYQHTDNRRLFSGKLLAIVRADAGQTPVVTASLCGEELPIRKVELTMDGDMVTAKTYPENASYSDLLWRVTDVQGIDSPIASLSVAADEQHATLTRKGDGVAYVCCAPTNGREHAAFLSKLRVEIAGLGRVNLDPYAFVAGGLYSRSNRPLENGNEHGVATLKTGESHVGFQNLDFGAFGSDTFDLPVFAMESDPVPFEVWEGMPGEGGEKLADFVYGLGSIWAVYQAATCTLPRRLKGITTLCFVFHKKVHIKGFQFHRQAKAFQQLNAADCDAVYGDSYIINGGAIEGIGNNVSIEFRDMDFGPEGTDKLAMCWRSALQKNAVQIVFSSGLQETRVLIEADRAAEYREREFPLGRRIQGVQTVSIIFLPGCSLDLKRFRFLQ